MATARYFRIDITPAGAISEQGSGGPSITTDARHVAYGTSDDQLVDGDTNGRLDTFVADLG